jgi:pyruvate, water dikinase
MEPLIMKFTEICIDDVARVGGKNASLGEMYNRLADKKVAVPGGFATTSAAFWFFIDKNMLRDKLRDLLTPLDRKEFSNLAYIGK